MGRREYDEIINIMKSNVFWLYGYGKVARRLYCQTVKRNFSSNLAGFIVTDLSNVNEFFCDKPVVTIDAVDKNDWIIIAADVTSIDEINDNLMQHEFKKIFKGYFSLVDLECGIPIKSGMFLPAKKFFIDNSMSYWVSAIYLAAKKCNINGISAKGIYIGLLSSWLGKRTAEKDYYRFMNTVELCEANGFYQDYPIKICKDFYLLDGSHRIALSQCFGNGNVMADVYDISREELESIINRRMLDLDNEKVLLDYITKEEIEVLREVPRQLMKS